MGKKDSKKKIELFKKRFFSKVIVINLWVDTPSLQFSFMPYLIVSALTSFMFYILVGEAFIENKESILGLSGILIAGSWSYLTIETNKEVKRREEIIRFVNEYEDSVMQFIDKCREFLSVGHKLISYTQGRRKLLSLIQENKESNRRFDHLEERIINEYPKSKEIEIHDGLLNMHNVGCYYRNLVSIKGNYLNLYGLDREKTRRVDDLIGKVLLDMEKTYSKSNFKECKPKRFIENDDLIEIQQKMFFIAAEKTKSFEDASGSYSEKSSLCIFVIFFSALFAFWCYMGIYLPE